MLLSLLNNFSQALLPHTTPKDFCAALLLRLVPSVALLLLLMMMMMLTRLTRGLVPCAALAVLPLCLGCHCNGLACCSCAPHG